MKNNKFGLGVYTLASVLSITAVVLLVKSRIKNKRNELEEINNLSGEIDIFDVESE